LGESKSFGVIFLVLSCILITCAITFSKEYCNNQNGDSLIFVIASLKKLTWYFWGQDRLLNLIPALTMFISDPQSNLEVQLLLRALFSVVAPLGFAMFLWRGFTSAAILTTLTVTVLIVLGFNRRTGFTWFLDGSPYSQSLFCAGLGTLLWIRYTEFGGILRIICAALAPVLILTAYCLNIGLGLFAFFFFLFYFVFHVEKVLDPAELQLMVLHAFGIIFSIFHAQSFGMSTDFATDPGVALSASALAKGVAVILDETTFLKFVWVIAGLLLLTLYLSKAARPHSRREAVLICAAIATIVLTSQLKHVHMNDFETRYSVVPILALITTAVAVIFEMMCYLASRWRVADRVQSSGLKVLSLAEVGGLAVTGLLAACVTYLALGGIERNRTFIGKTWESDARQIAAYSFHTNSNVLVGEYWTIWVALYERLKLDYAAGRKEIVVVGNHRGRVMKTEFLALLLDKKSVGLLCLYATPEECLANTRLYLEIPNYVELDLAPTSSAVLASKKTASHYKLTLRKILGKEI
jgi:hypothetical protein